MNGRDSNTTLDESTQIQRLGVGATVGGLILIGVVSVSSSFNAASVLIALGAVAVLGEWIVSRSYTVGVGIGILGIFPLVGEIPVDLRFYRRCSSCGRCRRLPARATPQHRIKISKRRPSQWLQSKLTT